MKEIAIIGTGISGLTAAYLISQKHHVTVFEKNDYIGGHTATKDIVIGDEEYAIDTGFIVCNDKTYPNFLALLDKLGVARKATEMSFSVMNTTSGLEYNGNNLNSLFAQRRNLFNPKFWRLLTEILRFNKRCKELYANGDISEQATLGDFLTKTKFSVYFSQHYILPMGAAIWSTSLKEMKAFQLRFFIQFFYNHGLLNIKDRPQWYVISGGSREYIKPLIQPFESNIVLNSDIKTVLRNEQSVTLEFKDGSTKVFDEVIFACHSGQALALLNAPTPVEQQILQAISYSPNEVVLHTDINMLPKKRLAWASWNYLLNDEQTDDGKDNRPSSVTYNMNILQGIESNETFCVTLNQTQAIAPQKIIAKFTYHHPVFNHVSLAAQARRDEICGQKHTHFAGAYWRNGFHEDGVVSALDVAKRFGISL